MSLRTLNTSLYSFHSPDMSENVQFISAYLAFKQSSGPRFENKKESVQIGTVHKTRKPRGMFSISGSFRERTETRPTMEIGNDSAYKNTLNAFIMFAKQSGVCSRFLYPASMSLPDSDVVLRHHKHNDRVISNVGHRFLPNIAATVWTHFFCDPPSLRGDLG